MKFICILLKKEHQILIGEEGVRIYLENFIENEKIKKKSSLFTRFHEQTIPPHFLSTIQGGKPPF
jgi:hypothetical protein